VPVLGRYAEGTSSIPAGFPNDSFIAGLTSNERVVQADANRDLTAFLARQNSGQVEALLGRILDRLEQGGAGGAQTVQLMLDRRVLARATLDLNAQNARLK